MKITERKTEETTSTSAPSDAQTTTAPGIYTQALEQRVRLPDGSEIGMSEYVGKLGPALIEAHKRIEQLENYLRAGQNQTPIIQNGGPGLLQQLIATGGQIATAIAQGFAHSGNDEMSKMALTQFMETNKAVHDVVVRKLVNQAIT